MDTNVSSDDVKIKEMRFELAWRWFEMHSGQRVSMLNFFLVSAGVLANAYVFLLINNWYLPAGVLGCVAAVVSLLFIMLDRRNHQLVKMGEDLIAHLEATELGTRRETSGSEQKTSSRGLLMRELVEGEPPFYTKHWFLINGVELLVGCSFLAGGLYALTR